MADIMSAGGVRGARALTDSVRDIGDIERRLLADGGRRDRALLEEAVAHPCAAHTWSLPELLHALAMAPRGRTGGV